MISKSDLIILVVASSALAVGIFRWHQNTQDVRAITIPASSRVVVESGQDTALPAVNNTDAVNTVADASEQAGTEIQNGTQAAVQLPTEQVVITKPIVRPIVKPIVKPIVVEASSANEALSLGTHLVQSGDYLGKIASQYGTDVETLRELNNISGSIIQIGQEIRYPL